MSWASFPGMDPAILRLFDAVRCITEKPGLTLDELQATMARPWAKATLLRDLRILKDLGLLENRSHRSGYFIGQTSFAPDEMPLVLTGLQVIGGNPHLPIRRDILERMLTRLERSDLLDGAWTYPVMAIGHWASLPTVGPDLHDFLDGLGEMIRQGKRIVIRRSDPSGQGQVPKSDEVYPLQLIFHDISWYLLAETVPGQFVTCRLDQLLPAITVTDAPTRGLAGQRHALAQAIGRLHYSWDLTVPPDDQRLVDLTVLMTAKAGQRLAEEARRHPGMMVTEGLAKDGKPDGSHRLTITLHETSLLAFARWVLGWGGQATVMETPALRCLVRDLAEAAASGHREATGRGEAPVVR